MNTAELERRRERAETETFIIAKTDEGYRVCSSLAPANQYVVRENGDTLVCTCPDYQHHASDLEWRCKHILAVQNHVVRQNHQPGGDNASNAVEHPTGPSPTEPPEKKRIRGNGNGQMLLKRSVSPDGRIDSLSVEFSAPVGNASAEEIKQRAEQTLRLQSEIMESFLAGNGKAAPETPPAGDRRAETAAAVPAQLLGVGGMNGKWGRRLFVNVLVNGQTPSKLFGTQKELSDTITAAGFPQRAASVAEGVILNLPCRVVTKQNGKYLNIERVLPAQVSAPVGA